MRGSHGRNRCTYHVVYNIHVSIPHTCTPTLCVYAPDIVITVLQLRLAGVFLFKILLIIYNTRVRRANSLARTAESTPAGEKFRCTPYHGFR